MHRPRFDDWSLPKGKLKRGEHPLAAAVREVHEETTVWGVPGVRLPTVTYQVRSGSSLVDKIVDWWAMTVAEEGRPSRGSEPADVAAADEVDESAWLPITAALERLTYERDRLVVDAYAGLPSLSRPVVLLHHAWPQSSPGWPSPNETRPPDPEGHSPASRLADLLGLLRPTRLISAQPLRDWPALAGLAHALALEVDVDARFDDGADPDDAAAALPGLASDSATVVWSQNPLLPAALARRSDRSQLEPVTPEGGALVLSFAGDRLVAADALTADNP